MNEHLPHENLQPLVPLAVQQLFSTLQLIYKDRFIKPTDNVTDVMNLWSHSLKRVPSAQIEAAAQRVMKFYPSHPPLIGEFLKVIDEVNKAGAARKGDAAIVCPRCRSHYATQHHADECGDGTYRP